MLTLRRSKHEWYTLADALDAACVAVPGTDGCLRSGRSTFPYTSPYKEDGYRTYALTPEQASLLLAHEKIPNPQNLRLQRLCPTPGCCNDEHLRILPCRLEGATRQNRCARIRGARTPEEYFPPALLAPITPRGHAGRRGKHPQWHISDACAAEILRRRYIRGLRYKQIADDLNLKLRAVISVCNGNAHRAVAQALLPELVRGARTSGLLPRERACPEAHASCPAGAR